MAGRRRIAALILGAALAVVGQGCGGSGEPPKLVLQTLADPGSIEYRLLEAVLAEFGKLIADFMQGAP